VILSENSSLHREMEQVFGGGSRPVSIRALGRGAFPAITIGNKPDAIEVWALAPGIDPSKLEISIDRGRQAATHRRKRERVSEKMKEDIADRELQRDVLDELKCDPGVNVAHIGVSAKKGMAMYRRTGRSTRPKIGQARLRRHGSGQRARGQAAVGRQPAHRRLVCDFFHRRGPGPSRVVVMILTLRQRRGPVSLSSDPRVVPEIPLSVLRASTFVRFT
jgi:hypothetical protein